MWSLRSWPEALAGVAEVVKAGRFNYSRTTGFRKPAG
jgi:hypothetical protein